MRLRLKASRVCRTVPDTQVGSQDAVPTHSAVNSLADFIRDNLEAILADWEAFARRISPPGTSAADLRDDAERMLHFIAHDMGSAQTAGEQRVKSEGGQAPTGRDSAAHDHGVQRFTHGFDMNGMVSEYRALRATVLRLWAANNAMPMEAAMQQLVRFNEGIDQAITESVAHYTRELDKSRDLFLAALGHDLRTPLGAIALTAESLIKDESPETSQRGARILRSTRVLGSIANDLLDFTRTRMGGKLPLQVDSIEARETAEAVLQQLRPAFPGREITLAVHADFSFRGDASRIGQALTNLVLNALQHGDPTKPVELRATVEGDTVRFDVLNAGPGIPPDRVPLLFEPWTSSAKPGRGPNAGLGLYIVRLIAQAHDGTVSVASMPQTGTSFTLTLPRAGPQRQPA